MRFLLDENVHAKSTAALGNQGHEVLHVIDSQLRGKPDIELIRFRNQDNRIFDTRDVGISRQAKSLQTGLILIRMPEGFVSRNIPRPLAGFIQNASEADLLGQITVLSPGQIRQRPLSALRS